VTSSPSTRLREAGSPKPVRRRISRRPSATHVLIAFVVILAFVLNLLVLQDRSATTHVAIAARPLTAGTSLETSDLRLVPVDVGFEGLETLIEDEELASIAGSVLERSIPEGGLIERSALLDPGTGGGLRSMSLPVPVEHAAGGSLRAGDRVDVISVADGTARFVAVDLGVISVADTATAGIGGTGPYHVVVAVEASDALRLAEALEAGSVELVRATGAERVGEVGAVEP